jgi:hypothetical protein
LLRGVLEVRNFHFWKMRFWCEQTRSMTGHTASLFQASETTWRPSLLPLSGLPVCLSPQNVILSALSLNIVGSTRGIVGLIKVIKGLPWVHFSKKSSLVPWAPAHPCSFRTLTLFERTSSRP